MKQALITAGLILVVLILYRCLLAPPDARAVITKMIETNDKIQIARSEKVDSYLAELNRLNRLNQEANDRRVQKAIDESNKLIKEIRERN